MGPIPCRTRRLVQVAVVTASCAAIGRRGKFTRNQRPLRLSLQCDFRLEVAGKKMLAGNGEEGSDCSQSFSSTRKTEVPGSVSSVLWLTSSSHLV